ncbi:MAG: DUF1800 domain-containing protein [Acidobacteriota bacterium]
MKSTVRLFSCTLILAILVSPIHSFAQQIDPVFEPFLKRLGDGLSLSSEQALQVREAFMKHLPKITELQQRARKTPYSQQLFNDAQKEQSEFREELAALLTEEQKAKLPRANLQLPIPLPPPVVLIDIAPRLRSSTSTAALATGESLIATGATSAKSVRLSEEQKILHILNRATFGARPGDIETLKKTGIDKFIETQLHPETIDDSDVEKRLAVLPTIQMGQADLFQFYPPPPVADERYKQANPPAIFGRPQQIYAELVQQKLVRAVSSNRQLQEVMTDFWFNHFNVFAQKDAVQWMVTSYERDAIRPNALGKFRDLLRAIAQSPAMMFYLDNWLSAAPDSKQPRPPRPNQQQRPPQAANPAPVAGSTSQPQEMMKADEPKTAKPTDSQPSAIRERLMPAPQLERPQSPAPPPPQAPRKPGINENYARELMELHTLGVDGGYTQKDVQEIARCFTGWTLDRPYQGGGFIYRHWMHDSGSKTVLGTPIAAGGGMSDGLQVIDRLARHPSTARFIAKKLCQRFVSDTPSAPLVERVAEAFLKSDGDIKSALRAIFTSPEFYSPTVFRVKLKSPLELVASAIRAIDADTNGAPALNDWLRRMGEPLYQQQAPTGYKEDSSEWQNTGVFLNRINFGVALANNQIPGTRYDATRLVATEALTDTETLMNQLAALITHTPLSTKSREAVRTGLEEKPPMPNAPRPVGVNDMNRPQPLPANLQNAPPLNRRLAQMIALLMGTAEFQHK